MRMTKTALMAMLGLAVALSFAPGPMLADSKAGKPKPIKKWEPKKKPTTAAEVRKQQAAKERCIKVLADLVRKRREREPDQVEMQEFEARCARVYTYREQATPAKEQQQKVQDTTQKTQQSQESISNTVKKQSDTESSTTQNVK